MPSSRPLCGTASRRNATFPVQPWATPPPAPPGVARAGPGPPLGPAPRDLADRRFAADRDVAAAGRVEQALVVERRVELRSALDGHAAMVVVAGDLRSLLAARHHGTAGI